MPELPEVEQFKKYVDEHALHQPIQEVTLHTASMLWNTSAKALKEVLENNEFTTTRRHGKFLFITLRTKGFLLLHFGMTGDLLYLSAKDLHQQAYVLKIEFQNGHTLLFSDSRMLGLIALVPDVDAFIQKRGYGPDALLITQKEFEAKFSKRKTAIKTALMNQKIIAGVGNEFSDAILFQCRIHPASPVWQLTTVQLKDIFQTMKTILKEAVQVHADREKLNHYFLLNQRKAGLPCVRCKGETAFQTIGGRSSYFCPSCQVLYAGVTESLFQQH